MTPDPRHTRFIQLWNEGRAHKEIASELGISVNTSNNWRSGLGLPLRGSNRPATGWSDADLEKAIRLWRGGMTGFYIANQLGKSRAAVVGKMHRLGLSHPSPTANETNRLAGKLSTRPKKVTRTSGNTRTIVVPVVPMPTFDADTVPVTARPFLDAPRGTCRWPIGERGAVMLCCGPVERGSYCAGHGARAYAGFPTRAERKPAAPKPRSFAEWEGVV